MARKKTTPALPRWRRYPIGVELGPDGSAHARVWAPARRAVELVADGDGTLEITRPLDAEDDGYFSAFVDGVKAGTRYRFRLDGGSAFPDPASRFQPDGPHGVS